MALDLEGIREIAARVAASYGLEIWDVELRGTGGKSRMLRVYIDRPEGGPATAGGSGQEPGSPAVGGVTHEDCVNVSRELGTILDVEDAVPGGTYLLEVSSPGLDRKLSRPGDFERFTGSRVKLMTREPVVLPSGGENRHFEGRLERFGEGKLVLSLEEKKEKGKGKKPKAKAAGEGARATQVEVELSNVERAHLVPEI